MKKKDTISTAKTNLSLLNRDVILLRHLVFKSIDETNSKLMQCHFDYIYDLNPRTAGAINTENKRLEILHELYSQLTTEE